MDKLKQLFNKYKAEILYLFFGGCTTLVNIISYYLFYNIAGVSNVISTVIAWILSVLFAYITNRIFVFESKNNGFKGILLETTSFFACRLLTGALDVLIMWLAVDIMHYNSLLFKIISNVIVIILNYFASKLFIFKKK